MCVWGGGERGRRMCVSVCVCVCVCVSVGGGGGSVGVMKTRICKSL